MVRRDTGERVTLGAHPVTIGREAHNTVTIDDQRVSRSHARVEPAGAGWAVVDVGSANGTRVNSQRLEPGRSQTLAAGDVIGVGPFDLRVEVAEERRR